MTRGSDWALGRRLWQWAKPHAPLYAVALVCAPLSAVLVIAQPWLLKVAIDQNIAQGDLDGLRRTALLYLLAILGGFLLEVGYSVSMGYAALRTIQSLRRAIYAHTLSMGQRFFDTRPTGALLTRATSDIEALSETLTAGAVTIALDALLVVGILIAMFRLDPSLAGLLLLTAPPLLLVIEGIRRVLRRLYQQVRDSTSDLNAFVSERLAGVEVIQLYSDEGRAEALHDQRLHRYRDANVRTNIWDALIYAAMDGFSAICVGLMIWYGSGAVTGTMITAGLVVAFVDYLGKLFDPVKEFSSKLAILQRAAAALEKLFALLDTREGPTPGREDTAPAHLGFEAKDLYFAYGDGPDVLRGLSLVAAPGEVVAVVGRTGSGKTTLGKLLTRSYDGYRGSLQLGGVEVSELPAARARALVGSVRQDVQIFAETVRFNLTLGADLSDDTLWAAIRAARAEEAVQQLGGLDARVQHQGANLSVGQAQLLSFARTLAHAPPILVLDEATASVDTLTEARLQAATEAVLRGRTVLVIAHRLSTVVNAHRIVVLHEGRAVEQGTHSELLALGGAYAHLYHQQQASEGENQPAVV